MHDNKLCIDNILNTKISKSTIHGFGLFATETIKEGAVLCVLDGQKIPFKIYEQNELILEWNAMPNDILLVRPYRTKYSFINHSRKPNAKLENNPLRVVTLTQIVIGEEITLDYRQEPLPKKYITSHGKSYL